MEPLKDHVILLPFMAQGHMIPFLALAKQLQQRTNFTITIVNTPMNINYLRSTISTHTSSPPINLVSLPFQSSDHGLPPGSENTEGLSINHVIKLLHASTSLELPFRHFLANMVAANGGRPPVCIISDVFMGWANDVAQSFNIVNLAFTTSSAYGTAAFVSIWKNLPHQTTTGVLDKFTPPGFPESCQFELSQLHQFLRAADGTDEWSSFFQPQISLSMQSLGMICNTVKEIEPFGLQVLENCTKIPVWCVGPLLPSTMTRSSRTTSGLIEQRTGRVSGIPPQKCIEWLDKHPKGTVLFVSFGSQNSVNPNQMMALAQGLEDSKKPFIWAIRPPIGFDPKGEFKAEWLPPGFVERSQGLLIHKWAPQVEILCHPSVGAFLSHCGWNSVVESLSQGVPIIGWPLVAEQTYNSKMLVEEMGVCLELARGLHCEIGRKEVRRVVDLVMDKSVNGKGEEMRRKGAEIGQLMKAAVKEDGSVKGSSLQAMDDLVSTLLSIKME